MPVNTGVNISKAVGYAPLGIPPGAYISKANGYSVLMIPHLSIVKAVAYGVLTLGAGQRGNIDYDQVRVVARQGPGSKFQMFGGGSVTGGHVAIFDVSGNVVDGGPFVSGGTIVREVPAGTLNGTNPNFTLSFTPAPNTSLMLYLNGVEQDPTLKYTISGNTITFVVAPKATDQLLAKYAH